MVYGLGFRVEASGMDRSASAGNRPASGSSVMSRRPAGQLLSRNVERLRGGLVFKAHRLLYHSTLGSRVIRKRRRTSNRKQVFPDHLKRVQEMIKGG